VAAASTAHASWVRAAAALPFAALVAPPAGETASNTSIIRISWGRRANPYPPSEPRRVVTIPASRRLTSTWARNFRESPWSVARISIFVRSSVASASETSPRIA